ncbi:MerR family transcriptional regulator [Salinibacterium sp. ZJ450]|uniref:MerR family transcriptional regulator n=1 Tax=Salinibacterium sp. ZJ450 TaxID=2708338 RepID=UPI00141F469F|nr:MerR family transcriptional regulator [Salinibacterium sp. ZJ450]
MRISELSRQSGVSPATIKYYAREHLLPEGDRTGYNQTEYGDDHVARLRLIRALIDTGGLSVADTHRVLAAIDDPQLPLDSTLGIAQQAIPKGATPPSDVALARVHEVMVERGWRVYPENPGIAQAASVLDGYAQIGRDDLGAAITRYAEAADLIADADLRLVADSGSRDRMAETVVVGTVLGDALIAGLRRIAQENASHNRFGAPPPPEQKETRS